MSELEPNRGLSGTMVGQSHSGNHDINVNSALEDVKDNVPIRNKPFTQISTE